MDPVAAPEEGTARVSRPRTRASQLRRRSRTASIRLGGLGLLTPLPLAGISPPTGTLRPAADEARRRAGQGSRDPGTGHDPALEPSRVRRPAAAALAATPRRPRRSQTGAPPCQGPVVSLEYRRGRAWRPRAPVARRAAACLSSSPFLSSLRCSTWPGESRSTESRRRRDTAAAFRTTRGSAPPSTTRSRGAGLADSITEGAPQE